MSDEWFDAYNIDHISAYDVLQKTGAWPKDFVVRTPAHFSAIYAQSRMAEAWVNAAMAGKIEGILEYSPGEENE